MDEKAPYSYAIDFYTFEVLLQPDYFRRISCVTFR